MNRERFGRNTSNRTSTNADERRDSGRPADRNPGCRRQSAEMKRATSPRCTGRFDHRLRIIATEMLASDTDAGRRVRGRLGECDFRIIFSGRNADEFGRCSDRQRFGSGLFYKSVGAFRARR